jgi:hypothetical protein
MDMPMKTHLQFRSVAFPPYDGEEARINPGRWGRRLAEFLKQKLEEAGIPTDEIYFEDWGCVLPIKNREFPLWIGCGNQGDFDDAFLCFIQPNKPTVWRWFRRIDTTAKVARIADAMEQALSGHPEVQELHWWPESLMKQNNL